MKHIVALIALLFSFGDALAQDGPALVGLAGAALDPHGMNVSHTGYQNVDAGKLGWSNRWQLSFRYVATRVSYQATTTLWADAKDKAFDSGHTQVAIKLLSARPDGIPLDSIGNVWLHSDVQSIRDVYSGSCMVMLENDTVKVVTVDHSERVFSFCYNIGYQFYTTVTDVAFMQKYSITLDANGPFAGISLYLPIKFIPVLDAIRPSFNLMINATALTPTTIAGRTTFMDTVRTFSASSQFSIGWEVSAGLSLGLSKSFSIYGDVLYGTTPVSGVAVDDGDDDWVAQASKDIPTTLFTERQLGLRIGVDFIF